jgi:hypothetical protein
LALTLRENYRRRVLDNRVLTRMFGPKECEIARGSRKLHEELRNLCSSKDILKMIKSRRNDQMKGM